MENGKPYEEELFTSFLLRSLKLSSSPSIHIYREPLLAVQGFDSTYHRLYVARGFGGSDLEDLLFSVDKKQQVRGEINLDPNDFFEIAYFKRKDLSENKGLSIWASTELKLNETISEVMSDTMFSLSESSPLGKYTEEYHERGDYDRAISASLEIIHFLTCDLVRDSQGQYSDFGKTPFRPIVRRQLEDRVITDIKNYMIY